MWQNESLDGPKRKVYLFMLAIMAVSALIDWKLQLTGASDPVGRIAAPVGVIFEVTMALLLWRFKGAVRLVERLGVAVFVLGMLWRFYSFLFVVPPDTLSYVASFAVWFGPLYVLVFLVFETKLAIRLSGLIYAVVLGAGIFRVGLTPNTPTVLLKSLPHLYTSNGTLIVFLMLYAWMKDKFIKMQTVAETMTELAHTDFLIGIPNRRELYRSLTVEMDLSQSNGTALSVILLDVDHFKCVNDAHGHLGGDRTLVEMTKRIRHSLGPKVHFGRWGGEEFMIICPGTEIRDAEQIALNVKECICRQPFDLVGTVTASFGVSGARAHLTVDAVIQRADAALYKAKANGRNRVEVDLGLADAG